MCMSAMRLTGVQRQHVDEARNRGDQRADHAAGHRVVGDRFQVPLPPPRRMRQIADQGKDPEADRDVTSIGWIGCWRCWQGFAWQYLLRFVQAIHMPHYLTQYFQSLP